jgi:hypothetical protein
MASDNRIEEVTTAAFPHFKANGLNDPGGVR